MHSVEAPQHDDCQTVDHLVQGRFSIRHLLLFTLAMGCWLAVLQLTPHFAILGSGVIVVIASTWLWMRARRRTDTAAINRFLGLVVLLSWVYLYVVSIGPARKIVRQHYGRNDMIAIYAPVGWLHANTPLRGPLTRYAELWGEPVEAELLQPSIGSPSSSPATEPLS